jgi:chaperonin GroEL
MEFNNPSLIVKDITTGVEGRAKIMAGVDKLANAVKSTLGASGKCVIYEDARGNPIITKDGVTVAESVVLWDPVENMGATMIKEAARNTVKEAGDGTTTATVLAQAIMKGANEALSKPNVTFRELNAGMHKALQEVLAYLESVKVDVTDDMLDHVAAISCNNDPELGALIAEAFTKAGTNGEVLMEDSGDEYTTIETVKGVQFLSPLKSAYWRTNIERGTAELEKPYILILTSPLNNLRKIQNILEFCIKKTRPLLIIGEIEQHPLATLLSNKVKGIIKVNVVDLPGFGPTKQDTIDDLALMVNATPVSEELGDDIDFIDETVLGEVVKAVTDNQKTILQVDHAPEEAVERLTLVKSKISKEKNGYIKKKLEDRINILSGSVSLIKVGAESDIELKEKKDRIEDAIYAVKAAIKEGIVPGGGIALVDAAFHGQRPQSDMDRAMNPREPLSEGEAVLRKAIQAPFYAILENADMTLMEPTLQEVLWTKGVGVDVVTGKVVDMVKRGIIDPVLVTKTALKNAVSVATTIISADAILSNKRIN